MATYLDSADMTIQSVQESFLQDNEGKWVWETLPRMRVKDEVSGYKDTTYRIPKLENTLTNGAKKVRHDADPPRKQHNDDDAVTITPEYHQTLVTADPLRQNEMHRLADVGKRVPEHLTQINTTFDLACIAKFTDSSAFTSSTFDGTGTLATFASDHNPVRDINDDLRSLRWMQELTGLSMEAYLDSEVARILAGYEDFQNAMYASSGRQYVDTDELSAAMMRILKLDRVHIISGVYNSAKPGVTASGTRLGAGVCWFGLLDRRGGDEVDMTGETRNGLDGGIAVGAGTEIHLHNWIPQGKEVEEMNARGGLDVITPRYAADSKVCGIFYPSSEIF